MRKVYIVTAGYYSDYHIVSVFSDKNVAEGFAAAQNETNGYNRYEVEEYDLDDFAPDHFKTHKFYSVWLSMENGDGLRVSLSDAAQERIGTNWNKSDFNCETWARDEQHAIKIANEKRLMYKAGNLTEPILKEMSGNKIISESVRRENTWYDSLKTTLSMAEHAIAHHDTQLLEEQIIKLRQSLKDKVKMDEEDELF